MRNYCIEAAIFQLPIKEGIQKQTEGTFLSGLTKTLLNFVEKDIHMSINQFGHSFWCLRDIDTGAYLAELHGFAVDRHTGEIIPVGSNQHQLKGFHLIRDETFAQECHAEVSTIYPATTTHTHMCYSGPDTLEHWFKAVSAINIINESNIQYGVFGPNSNSAYAAFAKEMSLSPYEFSGYRTPGMTTVITLPVEHKLANTFEPKPFTL